jgi:hypothetical protein
VTLTLKGAEVAAEIRNPVRGVVLWRRGADEQCLETEVEVAACSVADERRRGGLAAERHDGRRSIAFNRSIGEWRGGGGPAGRMAKWWRRRGGPVGEALS